MKNPFTHLSPMISLGLDIGSDSVKFVRLRKKGRNYELLSYGLVPLTFLKDKAPDEQSQGISNILRALFQKEPSSVDFYTAVNQVSPFSSAGVSIRNITLPPMSKSELDKALVWAAKKHIPQPLQETEYDYLVAGDTKDKQTVKKEIILVAASKNLINDRILLYRRSGVQISGITVTPFALWNLSKACGIDLSSALVVDIGSKYTTIAIFQNNILTLAREILTAGDSITEEIMPAGSMTFDEAEQAKKDSVIGTACGSTPVTEAITSSLDRLISEIQRSFSFHQNKYPESPIKKVYLTGGTACLKGLDQIMREELDVDIEVVDPFEKIKLNLNPSEREKLHSLGPLFALATGLALGGGQGINLVPPQLREQKTLARLTRVFAAAAAGLALILSWTYTRLDQQVMEKRSSLAFYESRLQEVRSSSTSTGTDYDSSKDSKNMAEIIGQLRAFRTKVDPLLLKEITHIAPNTVTLQSLALELAPADNPEAGKGSSDKNSETHDKNAAENEKKVPVLKIGGVVFNDDTPEVTLARFLLDLHASPFVKNPKLLTDKDSPHLGKHAREFTMLCFLE